MDEKPQQVRRRYFEFARIARAVAGDQLAQSARHKGVIAEPDLINFDEIDNYALQEMRGWKTVRFEKAWQDVPRLCRGQPRAIDLSLWYGETLCGLCFATPKKSVKRIKLMLLEGNPDVGHPLKGFIAPFMLFAVESYAKLISIPVVVVMQPEPGVVPYYQALGFRYNEQGLLTKNIGFSLA